MAKPPAGKKKKAPPAPSPWKRRAGIAAGALFSVACVAGLGAWLGHGCNGWDPRSPFEHNAPIVDQALADLDAGKFESAEQALESYLGTGPCTDGGLGLPDMVRKRPDGSFDLGLTLFALAERYGHRFGEEEMSDGGGPGEEQQAALRSAEIDCALVVVRAIAEDSKVPVDLRARAFYLAGNLEFLRKKYEEAVRLYDQALALIPGLPEDAAADGIGRDVAWNRAIALRRLEDQKDAGQDAQPDADQDGSDDASDGSDGNDGSDGSDGNDGGGDDGGDDGGKDGGGDDGGSDDAGQDSGQPPPPVAASPQPEPSTPPPGQEDRVLDRFEEAPTYQEQEAKHQAGLRRGRVLEDK